MGCPNSLSGYHDTYTDFDRSICRKCGRDMSYNEYMAELWSPRWWEVLIIVTVLGGILLKILGAM